MESVKIKDSYLVRTREGMRCNIYREIYAHPGSAVWRRSVPSLIREWRAHNLLYDLHICRSRTKDVDFDYPQPWYMSVAYAVMSAFYWGR